MREVMPVSFPAIDGREASGVVDEVGADVSDVAVGDEVFGFAVGGAAAEHAILDVFARKPAALDWPQAAGLPVAAETSVRVFNVLGGLHDGQTLVIDGATGGVGTVAVQLARARGARVIGTAGEGNHAFLRELGAAALGVKVTGGSEGRALEALAEAAALYEAGRLQLPVQPTFTFAQAPDAHRLSQDGHVRGKLVLIPG